MLKIVRAIYGVNIGTQDIRIIPILSPDEIHLITSLIMDSHTDTRCVNKHQFVESVVEVMRVDTVIFGKSIGKLSTLPMVNAIYAYDKPNKFCTIILKINFAIYIK